MVGKSPIKVALEKFRPVKLYTCDVFEKLTEWRRSGAPEQRRDWSIRYFKGTSTHDNYECHLSWWFEEIGSEGEKGSVQLGGISTIKPSPEEAVWEVLEQFAKWERAYNVARQGK